MARPLLLDTNLMVMLVIGGASKNYIAKHRRTQGYTARDFDLLIGLIGLGDGLILNQSVLAETSNLIRQIGDPIKSELVARLKLLIDTLGEQNTGSRLAVARPEYVWLGLADAVILTLAARGAVLLTVDVGLYDAACKAGYEAINFTHMIEAA